jgi:quinol monooxygenase YgiN
MPVNVEVMYEITLRTEYQQQMNDLMLPFVTKPGTINYVLLKSEGHRYEGFIQEQYQSSDNLSDFSAAERKFETKITLKVIGYLVGEGKNEDKSHFSVRQNFVEVKLSRETVTLGEIPDHKNGAYYGLPGVDAEQLPPDAAAILQRMIDRSPGSFGAPWTGPTNLSNRRHGDVFTDTSAVTNNRVENLVLKESGTAPSHATIMTVPGFIIKPGTETIMRATDGIDFFKMIPGTDYTIAGNVITFTSTINNSDRIEITYVKG